MGRADGFTYSPPSCDEGLNPVLYRRLEQVYGDVAFSNEGEEMILGEPVLNSDTGRYQVNVVWTGEYMKVSCPFCDDTRQRLYVNHRYYTVDKRTGVLMTWLATCFNEGCLDDPDNRAELAEKLFGFVNRNVRLKWASEVRIKPGRKVAVEAGLRHVGMPGDCVELDKLPPTNEAVRYLAGRGYDLRELGEAYGVAYCRVPDFAYPQCRQRIIIPVYHGNERVGWQARYVGETDFKLRKIAKYYTMPHFPKSLVLYNWERASAGRVVVVVEGVTDVWRLGREGVAVLGRTLSDAQVELMARWGRSPGKLLVLMFDGDAAAARDKALSRLAGHFRDRLVTVDLPEVRDPGACGRKELWTLIARSCRRLSIDLRDYRTGGRSG